MRIREDRQYNGIFMFPELSGMENIKIVPELVPGPCFGMAPRIELGRYFWTKIRSATLSRSHWCCEICGTFQANEVHERYIVDNDTLILKRLVTVCKRCHECIHPGRALSVVKNPKKMFAVLAVKLGKLNQQDRKFGEWLINTALDRHQNFNHVYKIDWSMLANESCFSGFLNTEKRNLALASHN